MIQLLLKGFLEVPYSFPFRSLPRASPQNRTGMPVGTGATKANMLRTLTSKLALGVLSLEENERMGICGISQCLPPCFPSPFHTDVEKQDDLGF